MNIEDMRFQKSKTIEVLLIDWGFSLCAAVNSVDNVDDLSVLRSVITEYSLLASAYSESTEGFQEDLGVSLGEAAELKLDAILKNTGSKEWVHYLLDTEEVLKKLMDAKR